jgi:glycosyltransferase involved in cell wall biosynthesis
MRNRAAQQLDFGQNAPRRQNIIPFLQTSGSATPKVSVVIPTKNEEKNLAIVLPRIPSWVHEVLIVDGHSKDKTIEVAKNLLPDLVKIVIQKGKGKGDALRAGFDAATGDIIVMLDADGSMAPEEIPLYVGALMAGADFVKGSRFLQGGGTDDMEFVRYLGNLGFTMTVRVLFGGVYSDLCYGYSAFWKRVLPKLDLHSDGFEIETEMNIRALKAGIKVVELPSFEALRVHGSSNLNTFRDGWRVLMQIFKEFLGVGRDVRNDDVFDKGTINDEYIAAMRLLDREAKHLSIMRHHLSDEAYKTALDALSMANDAIRKMYEVKTSIPTMPKVKATQEIAKIS